MEENNHRLIYTGMGLNQIKKNTSHARKLKSELGTSPVESSNANCQLRVRYTALSLGIVMSWQSTCEQ